MREGEDVVVASGGGALEVSIGGRGGRGGPARGLRDGEDMLEEGWRGESLV